MEKGKFFIVGRFGEKNTSHSQSLRVRLNICEEHHKRNTLKCFIKSIINSHGFRTNLFDQ